MIIKNLLNTIKKMIRNEKKGEFRLLEPSEEYFKETYEEFDKRYFGFGKEIYMNIKEHLPEIFSNLTLYKRKIDQTEDSYALYENNKIQFGIQLDPLIEVIVLWNKYEQIEIGTWTNNEYEESLNFIKSYLI